MAKISKTIKKLRVAHGLTQDALAEKLFVARQTVSSWENDRTQPDVEMLKMMSDVFGVTIEELIYGEKRRTDPNAENDKARKILTIVFAALASVLVGSGLVLIFITGWQNFPVYLKTVFAFVPMLAGQAAVLYTYLKRRESAAWREGASVLLCAAVAGTVAMVDGIYNLSSDFLDCVLIDALLILPVIYLLDAAAPLIFCYVSAIYYGFHITEYYGLPLLLVIPLLCLPGLGYVIMNRKKTDDARHIYTVWLSVGAAVTVAVLSSTSIGSVAAITAAFLAVYALDRKTYRYYPFRTAGIVSTAVISAIAVYGWEPANYYLYFNKDYKLDIPAIISSCIIVIAAAICVIIGRGSFKKDIPKIVFCSSAALCAGIEFLPIDNNSQWISTILFGLTVVQAIALIIKGSKELKFIPLNAGLILIGVLLAYIIIDFEISMLGMGLIFVALGAILFLINFKTAKKVQTEKEVDAHA